jgi:hypothetical protein
METSGVKALERSIYRLLAKLFLIVIALLLVAALMIRIVGPPTTEIRDWYDLDAVRNNLEGRYILMNNLDSSTAGYEELASETANEGRGWQPIGSSRNPFSGFFDGQGLEIRGLFINRPDNKCVGLFGSLRMRCIIKNVGVVKVTINGEISVGGLIGVNYGDISNSYTSGKVIANKDVGGLVGSMSVHGSVSNSYSIANVSGDDSIGGLVGDNKGHVTNSYSSGYITGKKDFGGLVGCMGVHASVSNSFWDTETSGIIRSARGKGKTTAAMHDITTFSGAGWNITAVINPSMRNTSYIWNIVDGETYPYLSSQP